MQIDIRDVMTTDDKEEDFSVTPELESFESRIGVFPVAKKEAFSLHFANEKGKRLRLSGQTQVSLVIPCDRCLTEVKVSIPLHIEKEYKIFSEYEEDETQNEETQSDTDVLSDVAEGFLFDVEKMLYGEILMNFPVKVLCREDCRGICKKCGKNLNEGECGCDRTELDPRMAAIADIFRDFQNR